jgi:hypothetical protein
MGKMVMRTRVKQMKMEWIEATSLNVYTLDIDCWPFGDARTDTVQDGKFTYISSVC